MERIGAILCSFAFVFVYIGSICDDEKTLPYLYVIFMHNCTYMTFDLTVTLNRKIMLGIHLYVVCNIPRNNSSLDVGH